MTDFGFIPVDVSTGSIELTETPHRSDEELVEWIVKALRKHGLCDRRVWFNKSHGDVYWEDIHSPQVTSKVEWWSDYDTKEKTKVEERNGVWTVPLLLGGIYGKRVKMKRRYVGDVELRTVMELHEGNVISDFRNYVLDKTWRKHLNLSSKTGNFSDPLSPFDFRWEEKQRFEKIIICAGERLLDALYEIIPEEDF